jgi:2-polyprenyl-3-methyl-5-hydroxy-6-metoxy-1,4-benzoquinol methylase
VEGAYDLVVAANVLHDTPDLEETLRNTRRLLEPGGYLAMVEFIDESVISVVCLGGGSDGTLDADILRMCRWNNGTSFC